jgi:hypothetical protein
MIPSSAALVGAYWVRLRVLRLEQRRVAGREPPSEQRSEGQPGYLGESLVHLRRHRALITATQTTDLLFTGIPLTDIQATRSRAMDILATQDTPLTPVLRAMDTQVTRVSPVSPPIPVYRAMGCKATPHGLLTPVHRAIDTKAARYTRPTLVPVMDLPAMVIPAIALRRTCLLGQSTGLSLLAEFQPAVSRLAD